jgi:uncharacterized protein YndB with AHSA1/START domain
MNPAMNPAMNRDEFQPSPLAEVGSQAAGERWTLVFVRELRHPPEKVWAALTEPAHVNKWFPFNADRDLGRVGEVTLTMIDGDTAEDLAASVTRAERPALLEYSFGADLLRWELIGTESGTRLVLHHTLEDRDWLPKVAAGWHLCLDVAASLLDGRPIGPIRGADAINYGWNELNERYAQRLGVPNTGLPDHIARGA